MCFITFKQMFYSVKAINQRPASKVGLKMLLNYYFKATEGGRAGIQIKSSRGPSQKISRGIGIWNTPLGDGPNEEFVHIQ